MTFSAPGARGDRDAAGTEETPGGNIGALRSLTAQEEVKRPEMKLSQTELDRVLVFSVAELARRRRARGLRLNYPEAAALITDEMMELARAGRSYVDVRQHGQSVLDVGAVLPGVPALLRGLVCEPMFADGPRIIVLAEPVSGGGEASGPGHVELADEPITINAGRDAIRLRVRNGSDRIVNVSSHYHFYEVNPRMEFDRAAAYGRHLDLQAGRSMIWDPGQTREVDLVPYAGRGRVEGFQLTAPPNGS